MSPGRSIYPYTHSILDAFANSEEVVVGLVDLDGRLLAGNAGLAKTAGRSLDKLLGTFLWDALVRPEDEPMVRAVLTAIAGGAPAMSAENPWQRPDGTLRAMRWFNIPIRDEEGTVTGVLGFGHDAEFHEALRLRANEAEQRFRMLEAAIDEVFYISDLAASKLQYASPGFERLWEHPVRDIMEDVRLFLGRVHPDDRAAMQGMLARQLAGERTEQEYRLMLPDGRIRWIRDRSYPLLDRTGKVTRVVGVASDVSSHRAALDRLADREQLLSAVFNRSTHALWLLTPEGRILEVNTTAQAAVGVEVGSDFLALPWGSDGEQRAVTDMLHAARSGGQVRRDTRMRLPAGETVFDLSVQSVPGEDGKSRYILAEALDITQRLIDRRERDEAEQRLSLAFEATSEGVWDWSLPENSAFFSPRWCRNLGYRPDEIEATPAAWCALVHPDEHDAVCRSIGDLWEGRSDQLRIETRLRTKSGGWFWSLTRGRVVERDRKGRPTRIVGTDTDIGQIKQVESRIRALNETLEQRVLDRTEALAKANRAKDEFLAVMSHELRTPMMAILGVAESIEDAVYGPVSDAQREALGLLEASGQHLLDLIGDLLDLSKIDANRLQLHFSPVPVCGVVDEVSKLMAGLATKGGQCFELRLQSDVGEFEADPVRVRQILVNLLSNSFKFAPAGTKTCLCVEGDEHRVMFRVTDEGPGLPMDDLDRLFRPFEQLDMQLARKYGGLGLGLALVHRLSALHGGSVFVDVNAGIGTCFEVSFPRTIAMAEPRRRFDGHVLLVGEIDATMKRRTEWMEAAGLTVIVAADLDEAHGRIALHEPDLVCVDADAAPMLLVNDPVLRSRPVLVLMSVVTLGWRNTLVELFGHHAVLEAPLTGDALANGIEAVLAARR